MEKGICTYTIIPVRKFPTETSEMITQILFGELFSVLEYSENWALIKLDYDEYEGWIDKKLIVKTEPEFINNLFPEQIKVSDKLICTARKDGTDGLIYLLMGSNFYNMTGNQFYLSNTKYELSYPLNIPKPSKAETIIFTALQMLNIPYLWGGRSSFGIDCSGLVQTACKVAGIKMPRDASDQAFVGETVNSIIDAQTADLVFFENEEKKIIHTGILISPEKIIHASGSVRTDIIDQNGIFSLEKKEYSHKLKVIKRIL